MAGNIPVGRNSDVTVAKTVNPIADIAAHGNFSVAEVTMTTLVPSRDARELRLTRTDCAECPENRDEVDDFLQGSPHDRGKESGSGDHHQRNTESDTPPNRLESD
jgi:hypothetical protein